MKQPATPLRALVVEDSPDDFDLLLRELKRAGYDATVVRVQTAEEMSEALEQPWDVVISDYALPRFNAMAALEVMQSKKLDLPFIIVSGTIGEEVAVAAMRAGAHDYLMKGNLQRLGPAVEREMREAKNRAERRDMQEQLRLSDRLVSVGTLAAGVGHEINNPLTVVLANLAFLREEIEDSAELGDEPRGTMVEVAGDTMEAAERIKQIVRDLKIFSRSDEIERGPVDLVKVLDSASRMAWNEIRHRAKLIKDYKIAAPMVDANEARLGQVFLNLFVNAAQALPDGQAGINEIRVGIESDGRTVVVTVRDSGPGIPADVLPRIFDPFFTTKPVGVGTGLGLSICHRIVTSFEGSITAENAADGHGAIFRVTLPASRMKEVGAEEAVSSPASVRRSRIVVIDDDAGVLSAIRRILAPDHDVHAFAAARDALAHVRAHAGEIDLILCDVMMPDMNGVDVHGAVAAIDPALAERMIFVTGGAFSPSARAFLNSRQDRVVEKPFEAAALRAFIAARV